MIRTLPRQPIVIQSFAEFTDNSSPPSWPTVSEQMAKALSSEPHSALDRKTISFHK